MAGLRSLADAIYVNETNSRDDVLVFYVEDVVRSWIIYPDTNRGLELEVKLLDVSSNRSSPFVHPRAIGLKNFEADPNREALLVIFSSEECQEVTEMDPLERSRCLRQVNDNDDDGIPLHLLSTTVLRATSQHCTADVRYEVSTLVLRTLRSSFFGLIDDKTCVIEAVYLYATEKW